MEKQEFRVHHAVVWARCKWLQVLLAERWKTGAQARKDRVEITSFSADVFGVVLEYLYTGCVYPLPPVHVPPSRFQRYLPSHTATTGAHAFRKN